MRSTIRLAVCNRRWRVITGSLGMWGEQKLKFQGIRVFYSETFWF